MTICEWVRKEISQKVVATCTGSIRGAPNDSEADDAAAASVDGEGEDTDLGHHITPSYQPFAHHGSRRPTAHERGGHVCARQGYHDQGGSAMEWSSGQDQSLTLPCLPRRATTRTRSKRPSLPSTSGHRTCGVSRLSGMRSMRGVSIPWDRRGRGTRLMLSARPRDSPVTPRGAAIAAGARVVCRRSGQGDG